MFTDIYVCHKSLISLVEVILMSNYGKEKSMQEKINSQKTVVPLALFAMVDAVACILFT